jgi:hypothetical protein
MRTARRLDAARSHAPAATRHAGARAAVALLAAAALAGCAPLGVRPLRLPAVAPATTADTVLVAGRAFRRAHSGAFDLYAQTPEALPVARARLERAVHEFGRHFGGAPRVAVLLFDPPADPAREFDFGPFVERGMQVLAFVRTRGDRHGALGVEEALFDARAAELLLASYADSVVAAQTGRRDAAVGARALDRLPHWFAEAVVSRVARPDAVEVGRRFSRLNRLQLLPLRRLFGVRRTSSTTWSELAARVPLSPLAGDARQDRAAMPPPVLLAAESTAFGEFLVDRLGPTALQALADELLAGRATEQVLGDVAGLPVDAPALESAWGEWLGRER